MKSKYLATVALAVFASAMSSAQLAFSSFDTGDTYNTGAGATISGPNSGVGWWTQAMQFESAESGILDEIRFAHWWVTGDQSLSITLHNDSSNQIGGGWVTWGTSYSNSSHAIHTLVNPFDSVVLNAGQKYWVRLEGFTTGWHAWNQATSNVALGRVAWSSNGGASYSYGDNSTQMAMDVTVRPVPEPATMTALGLGAAALLARRRRKKA